MIVQFLKEEGLVPNSQVLEIGCGNLSQGKPLIEYLAPGHFHGLEPNGWLVETALAQFPALESHAPRFGWNTSFDGSEFGVDFDFVLAHSVASHIAHWQVDLLLANTRKVVRDGAVFLCSYRRGEENTLAEDWVYPGHVTFRLETIEVAALHAGWFVEEKPEYQARLRGVAPNDTHNWLKLRAVPTASDWNDRRLDEEERQRVEREEREAWLVERRVRLEAADA